MSNYTLIKEHAKERRVARVKLGSGGNMQIPLAVTRKLRLRKGSELEVVVSGDVMLVVPAKSIPKDQRYFYTDEWQTKEREADEDIKEGRTKAYSDVEELIRELHDDV